MSSPHNRAAHGTTLFLALWAGRGCFFFSLFVLMCLGLATGIVHWEISFAAVPKKPMNWWEIVSLLASLGLSVFTAAFVFRSSKNNL